MAKTRKSADHDREVTIHISRGDLEALRSYANLGSLGGEDIMAMAFTVMMEAAKSAREDLKSIMDGVKAINKQKEGWRKVARTVNEMAAATAAKRDDCNARTVGDAIPHGSAASIKHKSVGTGTLDGKRLVFNAPDANGENVAGGLVIHGTGTPGGFVSKRDIDNAKEIVKDKLDSLSELGQMESLRLQMAMDRLSRMMSSLTNLLKKISDTTTSIVHNLM